MPITDPNNPSGVIYRIRQRALSEIEEGGHLFVIEWWNPAPSKWSPYATRATQREAIDLVQALRSFGGAR